MSNSELSSEIIGRIGDRFECSDITPIVNFLQDSGLMEKKTILRYVIKDEYYNRLKTGKSGYDIKMDLSVEYDIPFDTVTNIIYKYKHIKI